MYLIPHCLAHGPFNIDQPDITICHDAKSVHYPLYVAKFFQVFFGYLVEDILSTHISSEVLVPCRITTRESGGYTDVLCMDGL